MNNRKSLIVVALFQLLILAGCVASQPTLDADPPTDIEITASPTVPTSTINETEQPKSTPTTESTSQSPEEVTSTPLTIVTPSSEIMVELELDCPEILPSTAVTQTIGQLVLQPNSDEPAYLLDLETRTTSSLYSSNMVTPLHIVVSTEWLVFEGASEGSQSYDSIIFQSVDGEVKTLPLDQFNAAVPSLKLNEGIVAFHRVNVDGLDWLVLMNLTTNEISELRVDQLPGIFGDDFVQQGSWATLASFSPDLKRVIYMGDGKLLLWDLEKDVLITEYEGFIETYNAPAWSPDGSLVVFVDRDKTENEEGWVDKLVFMDPDGKIVSRLQFGPDDEEAQIISYSWSPDSRHLAFWLNNTFLVANLETQDVFSYCIDTLANLPHVPIWSPDSTQIAIGYVDENQVQRTLIIDFSRGISSIIMENAVPIGWMMQMN